MAPLRAWPTTTQHAAPDDRTGVTLDTAANGAHRFEAPEMFGTMAFDPKSALAVLDEIVRPGDVVLTLGAGDVFRLGEEWLGGGA